MHHGIYVGIHNGVPLVAECQVSTGVRYVRLAEFLKNNVGHLVEVKSFAGTALAQQQIIPRINALLGTQYDLIKFNCEHFAEYIQTGKAQSKQVNFVFGCLAVAAAAVALSEISKSRR